MTWPTLKTYDRLGASDQSASRAGDFDKSYLGIRFVIGTIGIALPLLLVLVDAAFLAAEAEVRGSMSAYYHSPARDLFVGGLAAVGVVLISYLWWRWDTWDFWLSALAGLAVIGVAAFPTGRFGIKASATSCTEITAAGVPCVPLQEYFGEGRVAVFHVVATVLVVASFAALCLVFALRDFGYGAAAHRLMNNASTLLGVLNVWRATRRTGLAAHLRNAPRTILYALCLIGVLGGALWALFGPDWPLPSAYTGEFIAFTSFGMAWMVASWDLLRRLPGIRNAVSPVSKEQVSSP
jgi:hypothetical protein